MSFIHFHAPGGERRVRGTERHLAAHITTNRALRMLEPEQRDHQERLLGLISPGHWLSSTSAKGHAWASEFGVAFTSAVPLAPLLQYGGRTIDLLELQINTVMAACDDRLRLMARLHGQCEIHCWVDGPNRAWLADIIDHGLRDGPYRKGSGWEGVASLLRERDDEPVVTSHSVTDPFPRPELGWNPPWPEGVPRRWNALTKTQQKRIEDSEEAWEELDHREKWRISVQALRSQGTGLEMRPDHWKSLRLGHGLTAFDLVAEDHLDRIERALELA